MEKKKKVSREFANMEKLFAEFQRGRECERRSIVARLKNKLETLEPDRGMIFITDKENGRLNSLEDICNFILEEDK